MDALSMTMIVLVAAYCSFKWGVQHGRIASADNAQRTPEPMVDIREALIHTKDAREALERAERAWNRDQLVDALDSSQRFVSLAIRELAMVRPAK